VKSVGPPSLRPRGRPADSASGTLTPAAFPRKHWVFRAPAGNRAAGIRLALSPRVTAGRRALSGAPYG